MLYIAVQAIVTKSKIRDLLIYILFSFFLYYEYLSYSLIFPLIQIILDSFYRENYLKMMMIIVFATLSCFSQYYNLLLYTALFVLLIILFIDHFQINCSCFSSKIIIGGAIQSFTNGISGLDHQGELLHTLPLNKCISMRNYSGQKEYYLSRILP